MSSVEIVILLVALAVAIYLAFDLSRERRRHDREREMVERFSNENAETMAVPRLERPSRLEARLAAAGFPGPPEAYLLAGSLIAGAVSLVLLAVLPTMPLVAVLGLALTLYLEWELVSGLARARALRFERQLIDAIDLMVGTLAAGGTLTQALRNAAAPAKQPLKGEFDETINRLGMGMSVDRAFARMVSRYDCEGSRLFALTIAAKHEAGGDLSPALITLNDTLRDRRRQQDQVRAQLAGARITAIAIVVLPYLLVPLLMWTQPDWFNGFFTGSLQSALLFMAIMLQIIGMLWLWSILGSEA